MTGLTDPVPGFDPQQAFGLRTVAMQTVDEFERRMSEGGCPVLSCPVQRTVYGASEDGVRGLDDRMRDVEEFAEENKTVGEDVRNLQRFEARVNRLTWAAIIAVIGVLVQLGYTIVQVATAAAQHAK